MALPAQGSLEISALSTRIRFSEGDSTDAVHTISQPQKLIALRLLVRIREAPRGLNARKAESLLRLQDYVNTKI